MPVQRPVIPWPAATPPGSACVSLLRHKLRCGANAGGIALPRACANVAADDA